jgi:hypothetical protein
MAQIEYEIVVAKRERFAIPFANRFALHCTVPKCDRNDAFHWQYKETKTEIQTSRIDRVPFQVPANRDKKHKKFFAT